MQTTHFSSFRLAGCIALTWFCLESIACNRAIWGQEPEQPSVRAADSATESGSGAKSESSNSARTDGLDPKWFGKWKGEVKSVSIKGGESSFGLELTIEPTATPNQWTWRMQYSGPQGNSERPYLLNKLPSGPGKFQIDEQNGILIDASMFADSLVSHFTVGGQTLVTRYDYVMDAKEPTIRFELLVGSNSEATKSGGANGVPDVQSLSFVTRQVAQLRRSAANDDAKATATAAWRKLPTEPYRGKQDDICFVDEKLGWYVNGAGKIFKTTDGGESWEQQLHKPGTYFRCIAFANEKLGFAGNIGPGYFPNVSDPNPLYMTRDGGTNWDVVAIPKEITPVGLCALQVLKTPFVNAGVLDHRIRIIGVGRVGGPAAMILSDDLGETWQNVPLPASAAMAFDVHFFNPNEGILASATDADVSKSNALILTTKDGGKNWTPAWTSSRPFELTWKIAFPTRDIGYVTVQSYNPDPAVQDRFVAKTTDGGMTWSEIPLVQDAKVREFGIAFRDELHGWVGAMPTGFETQDGGKTWKPVVMGNAVNKIRVIPTAHGTRVFAIGVEVHRLDIAP